MKFALYYYSFRIKCPLVPETGVPAKSISMTNHFLKTEQDLGSIMNQETTLTHSLSIKKAI